ncbi:MAG: protease HtpX [Bacteriovoracales bacterium]|nr:protease HtpX [Bacteriovoracales bacterium]
MKRWVLFFAMNMIFMITITTICHLLGIDVYLHDIGQNYTSLFIFCAIWGFAGSFLSLFCSKWMAKRMMGVEILEENGPHSNLVHRVHAMAKKAGLPKMPEVGIYESRDLNAFATGPSRSNSLVAVSTGLLHNMREDELDGVLAHEVAHIANGDMVTMTLLQGVMNTFVMFFARVAVMIIDNAMRGGDDRRGGLGFFAQFMLIQFFQVIFGFLAMIPLGWFSRYREYRADAGSAKLVGPHKMIAALQKLKIHYEAVVSNAQNREEMAREPQGLAAMKISGKRGFLALISTHPPLEDRIAALKGVRL